MSLDPRPPKIDRSTDVPPRDLGPLHWLPVGATADRATDPRFDRYVPTSADTQLVAELRDGDEAAFVTVIDRFGPTMIRVARLYVSSPGGAEDVVQETWLAVLVGLDRFEARCSLRTWVFRILTNIARKRGPSERSTVPFSRFVRDEIASFPAPGDAGRFEREDDPEWAGHWTSAVSNWDERAESHILSVETLDCVARAMDELPPLQGAVMRLRDVEGWRSRDVSAVLRISRTNERVLLHRARTRVRLALEGYLGG